MMDALQNAARVDTRPEELRLVVVRTESDASEPPALARLTCDPCDHHAHGWMVWFQRTCRHSYSPPYYDDKVLLVPCTRLADPPAPSAAAQQQVAHLLREHTEALRLAQKANLALLYDHVLSQDMLDLVLTARKANLALLYNRQLTQSQAQKSAYDSKIQEQLQIVKQIQAQTATQEGHEVGGYLFDDKSDREAIEAHPASVEAKIQEQLGVIQGQEAVIKGEEAFWLSAQRAMLKVKEMSVQKTAFEEKFNTHMSDIQQFGAVISMVQGPDEWRQISCILLRMSATLGSLQSLFASAAVAVSKSPQRGGDLEGRGGGEGVLCKDKAGVSCAGKSQKKGKAADVGEGCENIASKISKLVAETFSSFMATMRALQGIKATTKLELERASLVPWDSALPEWCTEPRESYLMQEKVRNLSRGVDLWALPQEMPGEWIKADVEELLMDVRYLRTVPAWIGELEHVKKLELGCEDDNDHLLSYDDYPYPIHKLPDLGKMSALTSLSIRLLPKLQRLPMGLSELTSLITLEITKCGALQELTEIGGLRSLEFLTLVLTNNFKDSALKKLPDCIGDLAALKALVISSNSLYHVPASIGKLKALTSLEFSDCESLKKLPMAMAKLKALKSLKFISCIKMKELPDKVVAGWQSLQTLHMKGCCSSLIKDVSKLTALEELALSTLGSKCYYDPELRLDYSELIASISSLKALKTVTVIFKRRPPSEFSRGHHLLGEIVVPSVPSLKKIHLEAGRISLPAGLANQLDEVFIRCGREYQDWFSVESLSEQLFGPGSIRITFDRDGFPQLGHSTPLEELPLAFACTKQFVVKELELRKRPGLQVFPESLRGLTELQVLRLEECGQSTAMLESICECKTMTRLELLRCFSLEELPASLGRLGALSSLNIDYCTSLQKLPVSFKGLTSITSLKIQFCQSLSDVAIIGDLSALRQLTLAGMKPQLQLPDSMFALLGTLEEVSVKCGCAKPCRCPATCGVLPVSIGSSTALKNMRWHTVTHMPESIGNLTSLKSLDISDFRAKDVPASFEKLTSLTTLSLKNSVHHGGSDAETASREQEVRAQLPALSRYLPSLKQLRNLTLPGVCQDDLVLVSRMFV